MFNFLVKNPNISHIVIAVVMFAIIGPIVYFTGSPPPLVYAAALIGTWFFGREAGQNNHDMLHRGVDEWTAFWQNIIPVGFSSANWQQFLYPSVIVGALGYGLSYLPVPNLAAFLANFFGH